MDFLGQKTPAISSSSSSHTGGPVIGAGYGREGKRTTANILVVDDVQANVELLEALLTSDGYDVTTAANGHEALDFVAEDELGGVADPSESDCPDNLAALFSHGLIADVSSVVGYPAGLNARISILWGLLE